MNRRNFFAALAGAPFALAVSQRAAGAVGERGPEVIYGPFPQPYINIRGSSEDTAEVAQAVAQAVARALPDAMARYQRNPHRRF